MTWLFAYPLGSLLCTNSSEQRLKFEVRCEAVPDGSHHFYVRPSGRDIPEDLEFFASLVPYGLSALRTEGVVNKLPAEFHGFGIMRQLLPLIAQQHSKLIYSSCNNSARGETRTESATAVWKRLVREGKASYDSEADRYRLEVPFLEGE
jgi:hypothetical protein